MLIFVSYLAYYFSLKMDVNCSSESQGVTGQNTIRKDKANPVRGRGVS
jgi:hypothetical protein